MKKTRNKILAIMIAVFTIISIATSCSKSDRFDFDGIKELIQKQKNHEEFTSSDIDFFLDQYEILINLGTNPNEDAKAYFESFGNDEKECIFYLGFVASSALQSRSKLPETLSDAQIERLEKLSEKYDEFVRETQSH